jgi:hypothetical protein
MKKHHLGPQNGPKSLGTEKLLKIVSCQKIVLSQLEKVGFWGPHGPIGKCHVAPSSDAMWHHPEASMW